VAPSQGMRKGVEKKNMSGFAGQITTQQNDNPFIHLCQCTHSASSEPCDLLWT
jgi:hypothetical protein